MSDENIRIGINAKHTVISKLIMLMEYKIERKRNEMKKHVKKLSYKFYHKCSSYLWSSHMLESS